MSSWRSFLLRLGRSCGFAADESGCLPVSYDPLSSCHSSWVKTVRPTRTPCPAGSDRFHLTLRNSSCTLESVASLRSANILRIRGRNFGSMSATSTFRQIRGQPDSAALFRSVCIKSLTRALISLTLSWLNSAARYCRVTARRLPSPSLSTAPTRRSSLKIKPGYTPGAYRLASAQKLPRLQSLALTGSIRGRPALEKSPSECQPASTLLTRCRLVSAASPLGCLFRIRVTSPRSTPVTRATRETFGLLPRPAMVFATSLTQTARNNRSVSGLLIPCSTSSLTKGWKTVASVLSTPDLRGSSRSRLELCNLPAP
jgi:hypothetical protein